MDNPVCIAIAGWKNTGKTTLMVGLVSELTGRGFTVSTIKHAHHAFDLDTPGTDTHRHREAGAREVAIISANRWAIQHELKKVSEPTLSEIVNKLSPCDLVLIEGYKREEIPKIEILGSDYAEPSLWENDKNVIAVASDHKINGCDLPRFSRNQYEELANFIIAHFGIAT